MKLDTKINAKIRLTLNEKIRKVTECQVKANNFGALFVDTLSPTLDPNLDYSKEGVSWVHRTAGHFVDGGLSIVLFETTLFSPLHFEYVGLVQVLVVAFQDTLSCS